MTLEAMIEGMIGPDVTATVGKVRGPACLTPIGRRSPSIALPTVALRHHGKYRPPLTGGLSAAALLWAQPRTHVRVRARAFQHTGTHLHKPSSSLQAISIHESMTPASNTTLFAISFTNTPPPHTPRNPTPHHPPDLLGSHAMGRHPLQRPASGQHPGVPQLPRGDEQ